MKMKKVILNSLILSALVLMSCNRSNNEKNQQSDNMNELLALEQGANFARQTQKVLGKNLIEAISSKGIENALTFCSHQAYPLTDSMAVVLNAQIKRVSDKSRNPKNIANEQELAYINKSKELLSKGEEIKPEITEANGKMIAYYPILTNQLCLQCHGNPNTQVLPNTLSQIEKLYPEDKALGYKINELRGIWVIEMNKTN